MNLDRKKIATAFILTLFATLCFPVLFPGMRLYFFAPFLVILYYQRTLISCLWISLFCGFIIDILSSNTRIGLYALNFILTTFILYKQKRNYFADSLSTLPLMTFFFSSISTIILAMELYMFDKEIAISFHWVLTDLIAMPAADALYAFLVFILPSLFFGKRPRRGKDYFEG